VSVDDEDLELGVLVPSVDVGFGPGGELLVGGGQRRSDVVGEEEGIGVDVVELNDVLVSNDATSTGIRELLGREDLPVVVGVVERVAGDLLTCEERREEKEEKGQLGSREGRSKRDDEP